MTKQRAANLYIGIVVVAGAAAIAASLPTVPLRSLDPLVVVLLLALTALAQRYPVFLFRSSSVSVAFGVQIAAYVLYGTGVAVLASLVQAAVNAFTPQRKPPRKALFNTASFALATFVAGSTYRLAGGLTPPGAILPTLAAVALSAGTYFVASSLLVTTVIALTSELRFAAIWRQNYSWMPVNYLATGVNGAALALAFQALGLFGLAVFLLPMGVAWYSFKLYMAKSLEVRLRNEELQSVNRKLQRTNAELEQSNLSVVGALVGALEAKAHENAHSALTTSYAVAVARKLGLSEDDVATVQLGALFHDIGKIGVPEHVLSKGDRLTDEEWGQVRMHPAIGANILARVPTLERIRPIVLAHHERYDGAGYPSGISGDRIPLGAQIVAVADAYEAMTAERAWRPALSSKQALRELRAASGTQFNPLVVEAFIAAVVTERRQAARGGEPQPLPVYETAIQAVKARTS